MTPKGAAACAGDILRQAEAAAGIGQKTQDLVAVADAWTRLAVALAEHPEATSYATGGPVPAGASPGLGLIAEVDRQARIRGAR